MDNDNIAVEGHVETPAPPPPDVRPSSRARPDIVLPGV